MAQETSSKFDTIESLTKEADALKLRLEEERQKLNDVTSKFHYKSMSVVLSV